jgi:hypothetical protein
MQFYGEIFRELTFHSKATSEKQKGSVSFWGRSFSILKNKFRHWNPRNIYICGQFESHFRQSSGWNGFGNLATLPWQCGVGECRHDNMNSTIWQCGLAKSVKPNYINRKIAIWQSWTFQKQIKRTWKYPSKWHLWPIDEQILLKQISDNRCLIIH